jgi:hypothetical protein
MIPIIIIVGLIIFYMISEKKYFVGMIGTIGLVMLVCKHYNINHPNQLGTLGRKLKDDYLKFDPIHQIVGNNDMESFKNNPPANIDEVPTADIYSELPELNQYQEIRNKIFKFLDTIDDGAIHVNLDAQPHKKQDSAIKMRIDKIIAYIFYRAYLIVSDQFYPQQSYVDLLKHQKELLNTLDNFIFLNMTDEQDIYLSGILKDVEKINKEVNTILIEKVNNKMNDENTDITYHMGFLPELDAPEPIDLTDDNFMAGQFTNW